MMVDLCMAYDNYYMLILMTLTEGHSWSENAKNISVELSWQLSNLLIASSPANHNDYLRPESESKQ